MKKNERRERKRESSPKQTMLTIATGQIESNYDEVTDSFDSMDLKSELLRGRFQLDGKN